MAEGKLVRWFVLSALIGACGSGDQDLPDAGDDLASADLVGSDGASSGAGLIVLPATMTVPSGGKQTFVASGASHWKVAEGTSGGAVDARGVYTAPTTPGVYHVVASTGPDFLAGTDAIGTATVTVADYELEVLAGDSGGFGYRDATGTAARIGQAYGVIGDGAGSLYLSDSLNYVVRKIDVASGAITTVAGLVRSRGSVDGVGDKARFTFPKQLTIDAAGKKLYLVDGERIRQIDLQTNAVTTIAGSTSSGNVDATGSAARFLGPQGLTYDGAGSLFVADTGNHEIRQVVIATGAVTTLAGNGTPGNLNNTGTAATFSSPYGIVFDAGTLYVADTQNQRVRAIEVSSKVVTTLAGSTQGYMDLSGTSALFNIPLSLAADHAGNLYVADDNNYRIRKIVITSGAVSTIAGTGANGSDNGTGTAASFSALQQIALEGGDLYVSDYYASVVRKVTLPGAVVTDVVGARGKLGLVNGPAATALFSGPRGLVVDATSVTIADTENHALRRYDLMGQTVSTFSGMGTIGTADGAAGITQFKAPHDLVEDGAGGYYVVDGSAYTVRHIAADGSSTTPYGAGMSIVKDGNGTSAGFGGPTTLIRIGQKIYVGESGFIRQIDLATGDVVTVAGHSGGSGSEDGIGVLASFDGITYFTYDGANSLYFPDYDNSAIRKLDLPTMAVTTLAVTDADGSLVRFFQPGGIAYQSGMLYVKDGSRVLRIVLATHVADVLVGSSLVNAVVPGPAATAALDIEGRPLAIDGTGTLYLVSYGALLRFGKK